MRALLLVLALSYAAAAHAVDRGSFNIDQIPTFSLHTVSPTGGNSVDADSAPTYRVYEDGAIMASQTGSTTLTDAANTDGFYTVQLTLSAANGYEKGKFYEVRYSATVGGITTATSDTFQIGAFTRIIDGTGTGEIDTASGVAQANVVQFGSSAGAFASGRPEVNATHFGGTAGTFTTGRPQVLALRHDGVNLPAETLLQAIDAELDIIEAQTDDIGVAGAGLTALVDGIWDEALSGHTTEGTAGDELAETSSGVIAAVDADIVGDAYTWIGKRYRAQNIVEVGDNFDGTLALKPDLNPHTTILTVDSVSITGAATVTATDLEVDRSRTVAHFTVPTLTETGTYTVVVTVTTIDGMTVPTTATLKVY